MKKSWKNRIAVFCVLAMLVMMLPGLSLAEDAAVQDDDAAAEQLAAEQEAARIAAEEAEAARIAAEQAEAARIAAE